jgi:hypothetical protein
MVAGIICAQKKEKKKRKSKKNKMLAAIFVSYM